MEMKSLKLQGFKSFYRETEFVFSGGTAAIVGPNGCGKSNVVDAIRWVLGEQSPRRLRGKSMEEILFSGSEHFAPANLARVSLLLTRGKKGFPAPFSDFEELCVERIYYRAGEGEYRINRMPVRLKDVVDLFTDTGSGTRAYSIIEQGYIGEIVSAGPEQLRGFIEEAAGIVKYKRRKNSAIRKMEATRENLRHIEAILFEINRQVNALNRQAQKARRYHRLKAEIRGLEYTLAFREYAFLSEEERREKAERDRWEREVTSLVTEVARGESEIEALRTEVLGESKSAEEEQARLLEHIQELNKTENKLVYLRRTREDLRSKLEEGGRHLESTRERLSQARRESAELAETIEGLEESGRWTAERVEEKKERFDQVTAGERKLQEKIDAVKDDLFACMTKKAGLNNRQLSLEEKQKALEQRRARGEEEIRGLQEQNRSFSGSRRELEGALRDRRRRRGLLLLEQTALETYQQELKGEYERVSAETEELQSRLSEKRSRLRSLRELQESYEGYQEGVRAIMRKRREEETLKKGIRGMVGEIVETEPEFETALESVLGEKLQYVIVEEQMVGLQAIEYLKSETLGRGSFIPLQPRGGQRSAEDCARPTAGIPLMDVVRVKGDYQQVAEHLLGDVVLVPDLETGLDLWRKNGHHNRIVSREGDLIDPDGVVSGGKGNGSGSSGLKTKREIKELEIEVNALNERCRAGKEAGEGLLRKIRFNEGDLERVRQALYQLDMEILRAEKDVQQLSENLRRNQSRLEVLALESSQIEQELDASRRDLEALRREEMELAERQSSREETLERLKADLAEWTSEKETVRGELNHAELELQLLQEKRTGLHTQKRQVDQRIQTIESYLREKERELAEAHRRIVELSAEIEEGEGLLASLSGRRREAEEVLRGLNDSIQEKTSALRERESSVQQLRKRLEEARERRDQLQVRLVEMDLRKRNIREQLLQKHQIDVEGDPEVELVENSEEEIRERLERLYASLARIGEVNPAAIEEYESLQERHQFYESQYEDLKSSLQSLERLIQRISRITKKRFIETFEDVNRRFQGLFPRFFGGGKAFLRLDDPADPLESGVEMVAQPPGKRLQNINLLSGGEKTLAALALVIAIFQHKPSPFCVLDEVDAALDDVNVQRFTEILKEISRISQFILITHNRQTMSIADRLYGITMESPGVSQLVSVEMH